MSNQLSIRSYSLQRQGHIHNYHQVVLPLSGVISIEVGTFSSKVTPGEAILIRAGEIHHFAAQAKARFVVADMTALPDVLLEFQQPAFSIDSPLTQFLNFVEAQLESQVNPAIEQVMFHTFVQLLGQQHGMPQIDRRIRQVIQYIQSHLSDPLSVAALAKVACLSETQFKKVFRAQTRMTAMQFLSRERMAKAQALLRHTDYPVQSVAAQVGFNDVSAFSRRFSRHFGLSPRQVKR